MKRVIGLSLLLAWIALMCVGTQRQWVLPFQDPNTLNYALSTIAQCAAALAALIGFLGLWRLDRLRDEAKQVEALLAELITLPSMGEPHEADPPGSSALISRLHIFTEARHIANNSRAGKSLQEKLLSLPVSWTLNRWDLLYAEQGRLRRPLIVVVAVTLLILMLSITGFAFIPELLGCQWTPWLIMTASVCLGVGPAYVLYQASQSMAPLEASDILFYVDKRKYEAHQAMLERTGREYAQRHPTDNSTVEGPEEGERMTHDRPPV